MTEMIQFYRGSVITFTVYPEGDASMSSCKALIYPDNLDLTNPANADKIVELDEYDTVDGNYVFKIPTDTTKDMKAGSYTIELYYGADDVVVNRYNNKFTLVDSGYALKESVSQNS